MKQFLHQTEHRWGNLLELLGDDKMCGRVEGWRGLGAESLARASIYAAKTT